MRMRLIALKGRLVRGVVWALVSAAAVGCQGGPPYRVSVPPPLSAAQRQQLGRIEVAAASGPPPVVWVDVPSRQTEGAVAGVLFGAAIGAAAGGLIGSAAGGGGGGLGATIGAAEGALIGGPIGAAVGGVTGTLLGGPTAANRQAGDVIRRAAGEADVRAAARGGAAGSPALAEGPGMPGSGAGSARGLLDVDVVTYGTVLEGRGAARPFVAVRARLTEAPDGRVVYESTHDWHGPPRPFAQWAAGGGQALRAALEAGARELAGRSVASMLGERGHARPAR